MKHSKGSRALLSCAASLALALSLVPAGALSAAAEELSEGANAAVEGAGDETQTQEPAEPEQPLPPALVTDPAQAVPSVTFSCSYAKGSWKRATPSSEDALATQELTFSKRNIQGVSAKVTLENQQLAEGVEYSCSVQYKVLSSGSWSEWAADGTRLGGKGKDIQAVAFRLDPQSTVSQYYTLAYRVNVRDCAWLGWAAQRSDEAEPEPAGTYNSSWALAGMQLKLVPKGSAPTSTVTNYIAKGSVNLSYKLARSGGSVSSATSMGGTAGTASTSAKNGVRIAASATTSNISGTLSYKVYQKGKGWSTSASQGSYAGSSSSSAVATGLKFSCTGKLKSFYDVYYRVYLKGYGWMGWAKNGALAGTTSFTEFPLSAYKVKLVPKGAAAPGSTANASSGKEGVLKEPYIAKRMQAKAKNLSSNTKYLLLTDTTYCRTAVFTGSKGSWTLKYLWKAGVGAYGSETPKGTYTTSSHVPVFGWEKGYNCWYGTCFDEGREILFHSEVYNVGSKTQMQSGGLGTHVSHGCVRLALKNAKWIYQNVPLGTKVVIF